MVAAHVTLAQVGEQTLALPHQFKQATPRMVIFLVDLEMIGEITYSFAQNCNLNFG